MNYTNLILVILTICTFYNLFIKKEGMSNTDIDNRIKAIYQVDINSIRNLSKLANDLTNTGKLVVPGGLQIKGSLSVDGDAFLNKNSQIKGSAKIDKSLDVHGKTTFHNEGEFKKTSRFYGVTYFKNQKKNVWSHMNWSDGNVYLRGNIIIDGASGTGKNLKTGSLNTSSLNTGSLKTGSLKINSHNFTSSGSLYLSKDGSSRNIIFHHSNHTSIGLQNTRGSRKWVYN